MGRRQPGNSGADHDGVESSHSVPLRWLVAGSILPRIALEPATSPPEPLDCAMVTGFEPAQPDPLLPVYEQWRTAAVAAQSIWVRSLGASAIAAAANTRFDALVRFARSHSPFYREAWARLHEGPLELA